MKKMDCFTAAPFAMTGGRCCNDNGRYCMTVNGAAVTADDDSMTMYATV